MTRLYSTDVPLSNCVTVEHRIDGAWQDVTQYCVWVDVSVGKLGKLDLKVMSLETVYGEFRIRLKEPAPELALRQYEDYLSMSSFEFIHKWRSAIRLADSIKGYYSLVELERLYSLLWALPEGSSAVEIGVQFGRSSSLFLSCGLYKSLNLTFIDDWSEDGEDATASFDELKAKFKQTPFTVISGKSSDAVGQVASGISLLHVDGSHAPDAIAADCLLWLPKVKPGGVAVFHDYKRRGINGIDEVFPWLSGIIDQYCSGWEFLGLDDTQAKFRKPS